MRSGELLFYAIALVAASAAFALIFPPLGFAPSYGPIERCEDVALREGVQTLPPACKVRPVRSGVMA